MEAVKEIERKYFKDRVAQVQSGDTVRVHQLIREGAKQRVQVFEGVVIRTHRPNELTAVITVRRIASGVGVEKTFLLHSPNVQKVEVMRRAKVRRNYLSYLRGRRGKSARLQELAFDKSAANVVEPKLSDTKAQADEDTLDAEVTELPEEVAVADESIDEVIKEEEKAASVDDAPKVSDDPGEEGDENALMAEEVESGIEQVEKEADHNQKAA